ncbi:unnamed protein product [Owenia fusiformis]|nr:unnamed protein product [Owenia fusiformis]
MVYTPNGLESTCNTVIKWMKFAWSLSYWTSPVLLPIMYRRGFFTREGAIYLIEYASIAGLVLCFSYWLRGLGRYNNPDYVAFVAILHNAQENFTLQNKALLSRYDFDFFAWPVEYSWAEGQRGDGSKPKIQVPKRTRSFADSFTRIPCDVISYIGAHTFGRRMVYPGATGLMNALVSPMLMEGRKKLVEERQGIRTKLLSEDLNEIDTMFVDRRHTSSINGQTLVVTSEGNAGFYEIGCACTPLEAGYSVLGWNHPGFAGSTGVPLPDSEQNAVDVVMQFAINKLGFQPDQIVLFAWSIGGYTATWAAMNYPDVKAVVLDATFDDLTPLAVAKMPESWQGLIRNTVRQYMHLNIAEQLCQYPGPILIIRRSKDEIITTKEPGHIGSNRGNDLLVKLLQHRYPKVVDESTLSTFRLWLELAREDQIQLMSQYDIDDDYCTSLFRSHIAEHSESYPMQIGDGMNVELKIQLTLFLASKYMDDFDATHCTPLPALYFRMPWKITF